MTVYNANILPRVMKLHTNSTCKSCQSDRLVICQRDGDIVCSKCGLVQEGHIVDDTLYGSASHAEIESRCFHYEVVNNHQNKKTKNIFSQASTEVLGDEFDNVVNDACAMYEPVAGCHRRNNKQALYCVCFILACQKNNTGVDVRNVYAHFQVPMWLHYGKLSLLVDKHRIKHYHNPSAISLRRMVYECCDLNKEQAWKVIQVASQLLERVSCLASKVKMSKLNACLIYIACKINMYEKNVSLERVSQLFGVSVSTLKKHELLIQSALVSHTYTPAYQF